MHKPHLLLLPGMLSDARLWQHQAAALADLAYVTVADLSQADSIAEMASKVARFREQVARLRRAFSGWLCRPGNHAPGTATGAWPGVAGYQRACR